MPRRSAGLADSLARLASSVLAIAHTRLELISVELSEAQEQLLSTSTRFEAWCSIQLSYRRGARRAL